MNKYYIRVKIIEEHPEDPMHTMANPIAWVGIEGDDVYPIYSTDPNNYVIELVCEFLELKLKEITKEK